MVFFPSYKYENWVWQQMKDITFGRPVFREPQTSGAVDSVLEKYAEAIKRPSSSGALLFSVVGTSFKFFLFHYLFLPFF